ncbi:MAG: hypothetical protein FWD21_02915, partial [Peptococcaceae bacterium]|nr:hypothetical protein [Peptococcaceae bacterium]
MKNLNYFPFERNRYFYGKLLTVSDFQVEQKYVNDKRRLINRFLYGSGVVCGLNVTQADDTTVLVEMGLALDFSGREIVVDAPVINKLSMLEGFESASEANGDADYLYLCLEYAEKEKEAVHNITDAGTGSTPDTEYNKFAESYRLFLTGQEPENEGITPEQFYLDTKTVYWGNGLRIKQVLPKYTQADGETELKIIVENMGQQQPFGFSYDLDMVCLQGNGQNRMTVSFDEKDFDKGVRYEFSYPLKALAVKETVGTVTVAAESISLTIGARELSERVRCVNVTNITEQNAKQKLMENYYRSGMDDIVKNNYQQSIYLAKIGITKTGPAYVIKSVENMPFNQYVFNNSLAAAINDMEIRGIEGYRTTTEGNSFDKDRSSSAR